MVYIHPEGECPENPISNPSPIRPKRVTQAHSSLFRVQKTDSTPGCASAGCVGALFGVILIAIGQVLIADKLQYIGIPTLVIGIIIVVFGLAIGAVQGAATLTGPCPYCWKEISGGFPGFTCPHCEGRIIVLKNNMFFADDDVTQDDILISKRKQREMLGR